MSDPSQPPTENLAGSRVIVVGVWPDAADQILMPEAFCIAANCSLRTAARWRMNGSGPPFIKLGPRRIGYRRSAVEAWLSDRERHSTLDRRSA